MGVGVSGKNICVLMRRREGFWGNFFFNWVGIFKGFETSYIQSLKLSRLQEQEQMEEVRQETCFMESDRVRRQFGMKPHLMLDLILHIRREQAARAAQKQLWQQGRKQSSIIDPLQYEKYWNNFMKRCKLVDLVLPWRFIKEEVLHF